LQSLCIRPAKSKKTILKPLRFPPDLPHSSRSGSAGAAEFIKPDPQSCFKVIQAKSPRYYVSAAKVQKVNASPVSGKDGKDSSAEVMSLPLNPVYYGGEVGFMYGHSSGKFGGDEFGTYIEGGVGNDKFQINARASYQEWNGRFPRFRH
jgi:hypothetical protein